MLDVSFHVVTGKRVKIGEIRFRGLKDDENIVRRRLLVHSGENYGAGKIETARKDLLATGVFSSVSVTLGNRRKARRVSCDFRVARAQQHAAASVRPTRVIWAAARV